MPSQTFTSSGTWDAPNDLSGSVTVQAWGEGGNGFAGSSTGGGGGGGGEYASDTVTVVPLAGVLTITIGTGGTSTNTTVTGGSITVTAHFGHTGSLPTGGAAGSGSSNSIHHNGGTGGAGGPGGNDGGGGGGSSAGTSAAGNTGGAGGNGTPGTGGSAPAGGSAGGNGAYSIAAVAGTAPGGGGGGGGTNSFTAGAAGGHGQVIVTWSTADGPTGNAGITAVFTDHTGRSGSFKGYMGVFSSNPKVVNAWSADFAQPTSGPMPPGLQSVVIPLDSATSVGGGSGTSTAGNWLFCIVGWQNSPYQPDLTVGVADDIHSWWRPQAPSSTAGNSVTTIWYTPNIARQVNYVYVAPNSPPAGISVLVVEVQGLGPWDLVVNGIPSPAGYDTNYAAASTSLPLALSAPTGTAFILGAVTGDNDTKGTAFAPTGWSALPTVTATDGSDHLCDAVLVSAWVNTSSSVSVSGTASGAEDLSGAVISVLQTAPSPVPASQNPNWPLTKLELGFGSGFQTPLEQITWTDLTSRALSWDETTGVQYQLGQILSTELSFELDNYDFALTPTNVNSPYYPNITTGTPIRLRFALGTIGGQTINRWYVIHRNVLEWPEEITEILRPIINAEGTDGWFDMSATTNTPYRNEVYWDAPYAWWPCDDQPLSYGVLPTVLLNSANNNTNVLNIQLSPNGATLQPFYSTGGTNVTSDMLGYFIPGRGSLTPQSQAESVATYSVGADQGWMFGDPQSLYNNNIATGGQATSNPGSAAWQTTGQIGNSGSYGWFLYCNDADFPQLTSGITVEGWFNYSFLGSSGGIMTVTPSVTAYDIAQQPYAALTLLELAYTGLSGTGPVALLQLTTAGHLNLITYNGSTPTTTSVYSSSDLRAETWFHVAMELTGSTYLVYVNGGLRAAVSGSATINTAWNWLIVNGDLASNGGSSAGTGLVHGGNVSVSHLAIYPALLPEWRILSHYWTAVTGNGLIPAPESPQIAPTTYTINPGGGAENPVQLTYTADGTAGGYSAGGAGYGQTGSSGNNAVFYAFSLIAVANVGSYISGPSAWTVATGVGDVQTSGADSFTEGQVIYVSWTGTADNFSVYTGNSVGGETQAVIVVANSDSFSSGYGSSGVSTGPGKISGGSGGDPPTAPSSIGDTVGQRLERIIQQGLYTVPLRCIDPSGLLVQAPGSNGAGLQTAEYLQAIQQSDDGMLFIDNMGMLTYWQKSHLAAQYSTPVWQIGPNTAAGAVPYYVPIKWILDPHRIWNAISVQPFDPNSAQLPVYTPSNATGVLASQKQNGPQPLQVVSWLQSQTEMQTQANWLFANFGQPNRRSENVEIEAASSPAAWNLVAGVNVGDIVQMQDWNLGDTGPTYTYRVTRIKRTFSYGARNGEVKGSVVLQLDWEPNNYWS